MKPTDGTKGREEKMKLTFLGTAAAEGCPALFCNCRACALARERGGRDLRTRSQSLVNDDLLIDFPPDTLSHFQMNGLRGDRVENLLITHFHHDHYYWLDMRLHGSYYAYRMEREKLRILCPATVFDDLRPRLATLEREILDTLELVRLEAYTTVDLGRYRVTPLPARHAPGSVAFFYVIEQGNKTLLYAHDTGYFYDEVLEFIQKRGWKFDLASFDCTYAQLPCDNEKNHMGLDTVARLTDVLREIGAVNEETRLFVNHFSHNGSPVHAEMEALAEPMGCSVAYDGCSVEF